MNNDQIHVPGTRTVTGDGFKVELDLSSQVLAVEAPIDLDFDFERDFEPGPAAAPLSATLGPSDSTALVSTSVLAQKAKIFDDGLYAAVEVAAQDGAGRHPGKAALFASLGRALAEADPSVAGTAQKLLLGARAWDTRLSKVSRPPSRPARNLQSRLSSPTRRAPNRSVSTPGRGDSRTSSSRTGCSKARLTARASKP